MQGKRAQNSLGFLNTRESLSMQNLKEIKEKKSRDKLWWPQKFQPIVELNIITDLKFSSIVSLLTKKEQKFGMLGGVTRFVALKKLPRPELITGLNRAVICEFF